jgi:phenylacetic acid degradation protein
MFYSFKNFVPVVPQSSYVHPNAIVIGNVLIGNNCYIGPGAVLRADWGKILIEDGCNVQENCVLHMFPGKQVWLKANAHIGHGAVIHGATIGVNCLVGINSVVMDDVVLEDECIVGALSFLKEKTIWPKRSLIVGNPAKVIKEVSNEMLDWKTRGTQLYQTLPNDMQLFAQECEPLLQVEEDRPSQELLLKNWHEIKK